MVTDRYKVFTNSQVTSKEKGLPSFFLGNSQEEAEQVYKSFQRILNKVSSSYAISTGLDKNDLFGEALKGLSCAKRDYDPTRGSTSFKAFALFKINDKLNEYVRRFISSVTIPAYIKRANRQIYKLKVLLKHCDKKMLETALQTGRLQIDQGELQLKGDILLNNLKKEAKRASISFKALVNRSEFIPIDTYYDESSSYTFEQTSDTLLKKALVHKLMEYMNKTELEISNAIMKGKSTTEIAKDFGKSVGWVSKAIKTMRSKLLKRIGGITE